MRHCLVFAWMLVVAATSSHVGLCRTPSDAAGRADKTDLAWTLEDARDQLRLSPEDPYLQYVALQLARGENQAATVASEIRNLNRRRGWDPNRRVDLLAMFTGALAVQESLQLDTMVAVGQDGAAIPNAAEATVPVSSLSGPSVKSHPWGEMLAAQSIAGRKAEVSPLALCVPEDQYFVLFGSVDKLLEASELGDLWGAHLFSQAAGTARSYQTSRRVKEQLAVETDPLTRPFYDMVVDEVAMTGSDLYFRVGSDLAILFSLKQPDVFRLRMDGFLDAAQKSRPDAERTTGTIQGVDYVHVGTPDRSVFVYSAYPREDLHVRTNSKAALERVLATIAGRGDVRPLGRATEFKYIRTLMPRGAEEEDGFVYLSDPFIRRVVGAELKLTNRRRLLCYNHLRMIGHAAMLYRTQYGRQAQSLEALAAAGCAPGVFGTGELRCPCGGRYRLADDGATGACSHHGHVENLVPCIEIPQERVTSKEADEYRQFVERYSRYWQRFFDPIAVRLQIAPEQYRAETIVLPLIDNTIYSTVAAALGGEPQPLDALPVPKRNIFSMALKVDKARLLKQAGIEPPGPEAGAISDAETRIEASAIKMKQMGLAMHNFHDVNKAFPAQASFDAAGRPLLSWRVHLLPYLDQNELYRQFRLDEPWNSEHNRKLVARMPAVYEAPGRKNARPGTTTYLVPVGPKAAFTGTDKRLSFRDIRDGTSNTIMLVDAAENNAVVWTQPEDLDYDAATVRRALYGRLGKVALVGFFDGSVRRLAQERVADQRTLDALFTRSGGEPVAYTGDPGPTARRRSNALVRLVDGRLDERAVYDFLARGIGDQIGMHVYDASPTFDFNLTGFLGEMLGQMRGVRGGIDDDLIPAVFLVASLNAPVYVSIPVEDPAVVDRFLEEVDAALAKLARQPSRGGWFNLDFDFYRVPLADDDRRVRCYDVQFGPVKWRVFFARIGDGLYIASKRFILQDLAAMETRRSESADDTGPMAHAMVRIRAEHWNEVLPNFQLGWCEAARAACLDNLSPLASVARAETAAGENEITSRQLGRLADSAYGVRFFCPEGGRYEPSPDGRHVVCSVHGTAPDPRQPAAPGPKSPMGRLLDDFSGATASLTFLEDGLHAVVTVKRK